jgi:hypothetical protein
MQLHTHSMKVNGQQTGSWVGSQISWWENIWKFIPGKEPQPKSPFWSCYSLSYQLVSMIVENVTNKEMRGSSCICCYLFKSTMWTTNKMSWWWHLDMRYACLPALTENLALTGILRHNVDHVLRLHHLQQSQSRYMVWHRCKETFWHNETCQDLPGTLSVAKGIV